MKKPQLTEELSAAATAAQTLPDRLAKLRLVVGLTHKEVYGRTLLLVYFVYLQLELSMQACKDHDAFRGLYELMPHFARAERVAEDLKYYLGANWQTKYKPTTAVEAYVSHLAKLEKQNPMLLIPHCYQQYMATLAGGRLSKKLVKRSFSLKTSEGVNTYEFSVKSRMALRNSFKDAINAIPMDDSTRAQVLAECTLATHMNNEVVRSFDGAMHRLFVWTLKWLMVVGLMAATYEVLISGRRR